MKGMVAPQEGITLGDIIIIGYPPSHDASIFFRASIKPDMNNDDLRNNLLDNLRNIAKIYGLVSNTYVDVMSGSSASKISSDHPFGDKKLRGNFTLIPVFDEEQRRGYIPIIEKTIKKYEVVKPIFQGKTKGFLRNAIDYYYRSLRDETLEEKIIDLMISLESLFSNELDELGLRYSLRTGFLLGVGQEAERSNIIKKIQDLYRKRSKVVHGTEDVDLEYKDISTLQEYVRDAIKRLIHIEMPKQQFLTLLDESVYDKEKGDRLNQIVMEAIKKW
ncbi:MAG: hypothetical protein QG670_169 [Thermoproteota archaeon]|nr:hypothetical protein [Thermoproteota archaeon]